MSEMVLKHVAFRCDGNQHIGIGHLMRSFSLLEAWLADSPTNQATIITRGLPAGVRARRGALLSSPQVRLIVLQPCKQGDAIDLMETRQMMKRVKPQAIVVDGYDFDEDYIRGLKQDGYFTMMFEDSIVKASHPADMLLNQNFKAQLSGATASEQDRFLMGCDMALIRSEIAAMRPSRPVPQPVKSILCLAGGADPAGLSELFIKAVDQLRSSPAGKEIDVHLVIGPANARGRDIEWAGHSRPYLNIHINPSTLPKLMQQSDLIVSSAGSTLWEMFCLGRSVMAGWASDIERGNLQQLAEAGYLKSVGAIEELDADSFYGQMQSMIQNASERQEYASKGWGLIDGLGGVRVVAALKKNFANRDLLYRGGAVVEEAVESETPETAVSVGVEVAADDYVPSYNRHDQIPSILMRPEGQTPADAVDTHIEAEARLDMEKVASNLDEFPEKAEKEDGKEHANVASGSLKGDCHLSVDGDQPAFIEVPPLLEIMEAKHV